jgi:hypothetical protein
MASFVPESIETPWLHNMRANEIQDKEGKNTSSGERKYRVDLFKMLNIKAHKGTIDIANQFLIATSGGMVTEVADAKKTAFLPGRVAVRISEMETEKPLYDYVFLNLNSLSKRLDLDKAIIKKAEANGNLHELIKTRIDELATEQKSIENTLMDLLNGENVFDKKTDDLSDDLPVDDQVEADIAAGRNELKKNDMKKFIKKHFSEDDFLMSKLDEFLENPIEDTQKGNSYVKLESYKENSYIKYLAKKLWWDAWDLKALSKTGPEKLAIDGVALGEFNLSIVYGTAASRLDNKGKREVNRLSFIPWDINRRYTIAIEDDFIYSYQPEPRSKYEVALEIRKPGQAPKDGSTWILVNKSSLKRLGVSKQAIKDVDAGRSNRLFTEVSDKVKKIRTASYQIGEIKLSIMEENKFKQHSLDILKELIDHPDEEFREVLKSFLDDFNFEKDSGGKNAIQQFLKLVENLEEKGLIEKATVARPNSNISLLESDSESESSGFDDE